MPYATPQNLMARYDARTLGDLAGDDGVSIDALELVTHANVLAALSDATGEINAAVLRANRYSVDDLTALTGDDAAYLIRICCDLAFANLWRRRPYSDDDGRVAALDRADKHLKDLSSGAAVFNVQENRDAGLPAIAGPSYVEVKSLNLIRDRTINYYPNRALPGDR